MNHSSTALLHEQRLLTANEVASILGVGRKRVYELGIPVVQLAARTLRWRLVDVTEWIERRRLTR